MRILYFRTRFLLILEIQYFSLFFSILASIATPTRNYNLVRDFFTFEIPARELYCPVTISGLSLKLIYCKQTTNVLLMFIIRTVKLLEISWCLSHLVCQLTLINILFWLIILLLSYYGFLTREPFSYSVVWVGIVHEPVGEGTIHSETTH